MVMWIYLYSVNWEWIIWATSSINCTCYRVSNYPSSPYYAINGGLKLWNILIFTCTECNYMIVLIQIINICCCRWVFIMSCCAIFPAFILYIPGALWKAVRRHPLIPLRTLAEAASDYQHAKDADTQDRAGKFLGKRLGHFLWDIKSSGLTQLFTVSDVNFIY